MEQAVFPCPRGGFPTAPPRALGRLPASGSAERAPRPARTPRPGPAAAIKAAGPRRRCLAAPHRRDTAPPAARR